MLPHLDPALKGLGPVAVGGQQEEGGDNYQTAGDAPNHSQPKLYRIGVPASEAVLDCRGDLGKEGATCYFLQACMF